MTSCLVQIHIAHIGQKLGLTICLRITLEINGLELKYFQKRIGSYIIPQGILADCLNL